MPLRFWLAHAVVELLLRVHGAGNDRGAEVIGFESLQFVELDLLVQLLNLDDLIDLIVFRLVVARVRVKIIRVDRSHLLLIDIMRKFLEVFENLRGLLSDQVDVLLVEMLKQYLLAVLVD